MGGGRRTPPVTGHVDLSMTRLVLEALRAAGAPSSDPALEKARIYVERCQNADGGFHFTTTEYDTNKAGHDGKRVSVGREKRTMLWANPCYCY